MLNKTIRKANLMNFVSVAIVLGIVLPGDFGGNTHRDTR